MQTRLAQAEAATGVPGRRFRLQTVVVPQARALGFTAVVLLAGLHYALISAEVSDRALLYYVIGTAGYCTLSWLILQVWYQQVRRIDLAAVFLYADVLLFTCAVYITGAEKSWLLLIFVLRAADQAANGFRPVLAYAHWSTACYVGMLLWIQFVDGRAVNWTAEIVKILGIYFGNLYVSLSALIHEKVRRQMRTARDLIQQMQQKTKDLEQERKKSAAEAASRKEFLHNAARELRTPIQAIAGMAHLLKDRKLEPEQREQVEAVLSSAQLAAALVNDILVSETSEDVEGLNIVPFSPAEVVRVVVEASATAVQMLISPEVPGEVRGDRIRVEYLLRRVLDYARQASPDRRLLLELRAGPAGPAQTGLEFCVSALRVAAGVAGAATASQDYSMVMARKIAGVLGGEIRVDQWNGQGVRIHWTIPFPADEPQSPESPGSGRTNGRLRILVAEDNQVNQRVLLKLLERRGHTVQLVSKGTEAVAAARQKPFDLILMDIMMPVMDGLEAAQIIRQEGAGANARVPIVAVTAVSADDERLSRAGLDAWLPKPFLPEDLYRTLDRLA
ncbi:MAG: response regulator [Bryobacteraceae bacterium]|nr:response regulator [Bryobacteraceae bacterium]